MAKKRGPAPRPATVKFQKGNDPSQRAKVQIAPSTPSGGVVPDSAPGCPRWLPKDGKAEWHRIVPILKQMGICSTAYRSALMVYCDSYALYKQASQAIQKEGATVKTKNGYRIPSPWISIARNAKRDLVASLSLFGLSPVDRQRFLTGGGPGRGANEPEDDFDDYVQSKRG